MYWVVLACVILVESWVDWFLVWYVKSPLSVLPDNSYDGQLSTAHMPSGWCYSFPRHHQLPLVDEDNDDNRIDH